MEDLSELESRFLAWARDFLNCSDDQSRLLLERTQEIMNASHAIPDKYASHEIPFAYCGAYLRAFRATTLVRDTGRPETPEIIRELRNMSSQVGVRLATFNSDLKLAHLPSEICLTLEKLRLSYGLSARCAQILMEISPEAPEAQFARSTLADFHSLVGSFIKNF